MARHPTTDRPPLRLIRQPQGLVPASRFDLDFLGRYRIGAELYATVEQPKDPATLRRFWALVGSVAEATGRDRNSLRTEILFAAKMVGAVEVFDGTTVLTPIDLRDLDEADLRDLLTTAEALIVSEICPGLDIDALRADAAGRLGTKP